MTEKCFDEGTIQAFLDGELETERLEQVARHTAVCEVCAFMLQDAEEESALAFTALGDEFNSLVPTERIRTSLYAAIGQIEKPRKSFWQKLFDFSGLNLSNPSLVAFGSLLLVFGLFTTLYIHRQSQNAGGGNHQIAQNSPARVNQTPRQIEPVESAPVVLPDQIEVAGINDGGDEEKSVRQSLPKRSVENQPQFQKAVYKPGRASAAAAAEERITNIDDRREPRALLPGEESYVKTIATLSENVNTRKDTVLRPSERVAFEKDLAVVNDAIKKMRYEVRKNPRNEAAKQVLRSSYQNKIELLNSVAERSELLATLR